MMQGDQAGGGGTMHVGAGDGRRNNDDPNKEGMKQLPNKQPQQHPHPQQPQKCPRCESLNTKFCYYNNYSLTQPRYFCKTCRRYWTQGGTLRNVPIGGGCRKGKRHRMTPGGSSSSVAAAATSAIAVTSSTNTAATLTSSMIGPAAPGLPPFGFGSYNFAAGGSGGGFLSSLAAVQSFAHHGAVDLGSADLGGGSSSSSNLGLLLHGNFNTNINPPPNFGSHQQPITRQFYSPSGGGQTNYDDGRQIKSTSDGTANTSTSNQLGGNRTPQQQHPQQINWPHLHHQGLMLVPDTSIWNISTITTAAVTVGAVNSNATVAGGSSIDHQWRNEQDHLPGHGPSQ